MLSDIGSKVIRDFGIFNTNIPPDHKMLYGIPFPGDFLIAPDGTVGDKLFLPSYEHRASASEVIFRNFGVGAGGNSVEIKTEVLTATITLSSDRCFPGQELGIALEIRLEPAGISTASRCWRLSRDRAFVLRPADRSVDARAAAGHAQVDESARRDAADI